jgi:Holliday junction resolvase RusA-like endonuclease
MADHLSFTVQGIPEPQGSSRAFVVKGRAIITSANKKLKSWRREVWIAAEEAAREQNFQKIRRPDACSVTLTFFFPRPQSLAKRITEKTTKPDLDKLARGALDSFTGTLFQDDSQVTLLVVEKKFGDVPRVEVRCWLR